MAKGGKKGGRKQFTSAETLERENRAKSDDSDDDDDDDRPQRGGNASGGKFAQQSANVGELPPNSSDEEDEAPPKRARGRPSARAESPGCPLAIGLAPAHLLAARAPTRDHRAAPPPARAQPLRARRRRCSPATCPAAT